MINPLVIVVATIVIMGIVFALLYLAAGAYERSEERRLQLENDRYDTTIEIAAGATFALRFRPGGDNGERAGAYLCITSPLSHNYRPATMTSEALVKLETTAEAFDEMAIAWIKYRGLAGAVGGPVGNELGSPENPWI